MQEGTFRYAVMGAGNISNQFCDAVSRMKGCEVAAVAARDQNRADEFAKKHGILKAYDNYEQMLKKEVPDAVYIGVTTNAHYELTMLCLDYRIPVLCEKAMFMSYAQAEKALTHARELGVFIMEGMWSRFLPNLLQVKKWISDGRIGDVCLGNIAIGFAAPKDPNNRYFSLELGGGVCYDITVYCYDIVTWLIDKPVKNIQLQVSFADTGVDQSENILLEFDGCLAMLQSSLEADLEEQAVIYGTKGKIVIPHPHYGNESWLYADGEEVVHYEDSITENGFVYEAAEVIRCIKEKKTESPTAPHEMTLAASRLFDKIMEQRQR